MLLELDPIGELPSPGKARAAEVAPRASNARSRCRSRPRPRRPLANQPVVVEEDEDAEPWIESARCSTCNDCVNLNSLLFVYDGNKQAKIGDPRAGSYAQLVQAAEKCRRAASTGAAAEPRRTRPRRADPAREAVPVRRR
ncbi:MAG: hypothetical protein H6835_01905 [Planctomycetes bacterium]|nr:hypothetical protein [Planctomycetota bacterium]